MPRLTNKELRKALAMDVRPSLAAHIHVEAKDKRRARLAHNTNDKARSRAANVTYRGI